MDMLSFGQKIKKLRTDVGLSQALLAEQIGVSVQSISNWECNNTMPDISQIVPLAGILSVSTDYLLGVGLDEKTDKEILIKNVNTIWANYSVNTKENNADLLVANLYKEYLRKYPTDYAVKYKCALALYDYLLVSKVRGKFQIEIEDFDSIYGECNLMLSSICNNAASIELLIKANKLFIHVILLSNKYDEAMRYVEKLPTISGIKENAWSKVLYAKNSIEKANQVKVCEDKEKCLDYLMALFESAACDAYTSDNSILILEYAEIIAKYAVSLYLETTILAVNSYEKMPYCYLITAYTMQCKIYLLKNDYGTAYKMLEKATNTACEMFTWVKEKTTDKEVLEDYKFFALKTPHWSFSFSGLFSSDENEFTKSEKYKRAVKKIDKILSDEI